MLLKLTFKVTFAVSLLAMICAVTSVDAFTVQIHREITRSELEALTAEVDGEPQKFSERAVEQVMDANETMDRRFNQALFRPERHFTNEEYQASTQRLIDLRQRVIDSVTASSPNGARARQALGEALHLVQDFYAHSNWVELGNGVNTSLGQSVSPNPPVTTDPCPTNPNVLGPGGGGSATSAYFVGITLNRDTFGCKEDELPDAGKCFHGNYTLNCIGINKDNNTVVNGVPVSPFHGTARSLAETSTTNYVQSILDELAGNDKALAALLDLRGTAGFVIDDTGSMGPEISGVKSVVSQIVSALSGSPDLEPDNWLLERFGDPDVGVPFVTSDSSTLLGAVNALSPGGGGDCPELSQTALLRAVEEALPLSRLYFFSDASAKDSGLRRAVVRRAQDKGTRIIYALTGTCSPVDEAYVIGAAETGGQLFVLNQFELSKLFDLIEPQLPGDLTTVLRRSGHLAGAIAAFAVPVDTSMTSLVVSTTVDVKDDVVVRRPSGLIAAETDADVERIELSGATIIKIDGPEVGEWSIEVAGSGAYSLLVEGNSPLELFEVEFVEENDEIHGGFFAIAGEPIRGEPAILEVTLLGPFGTGSFELVDRQGESLGPVFLEQNFPGDDPEHFLGELVPLSVPFRVVATGVDLGGAEYRREFPKLFRAQSVLVRLDGLSSDTINPEGTVELSFEVANLSLAAGTFNLLATDSLGRTIPLPTGSVFLEGDASTLVSFDYTLPLDATELDGVVVVLTATRVGDPDIFNSDIAELQVVSNRDPVCPEPSDAVARLWPPKHQMVELRIADLVEVVDPDGDPVLFEIDGIAQDESVDGLGSGDTAPDAEIKPGGVFLIRAERSGTGNGRIYEVAYTALDGRGGACSSTTLIEVPHSQSTPAVDSGDRFDSTTVP
jgi:von Willebrand factor A domain-containing protein 7